MKYRNVLLLAASLLSFSITQARADDADVSAQSSSAEAPTATVAPAMPAKAPTLNIKWNCGDCTVNEKVIPLIEQSYSGEASSNNQPVDKDDVAEAEIFEFRQRNPGMRVMFGVMAGKDRLGLKIKYKGKELTAEDYSANAFEGMNAVCDSVGKIAYKKIMEAGAQ